MSRHDKWPDEVDRAIRETVAGGKLAPMEALVKIRAGTLVDGLHPVDLPERTLYYRWTRAQRQLRRAAEQQAEFPRLIHRLMAAMVDRHGDLGPEQLAEAIREEFDQEWTPAEAQQVIAARAEWAAPVGGNPT